MSLYTCKQTTGSIDSTPAFRDNGCTGGLATSVANADIVFDTELKFLHKIYLANLPTAIMAFYNKETATYVSHYSVIEGDATSPIIRPKNLGLKFEFKLKESDVAKLTAMGLMNQI